MTRKRGKKKEDGKSDDRSGDPHHQPQPSSSSGVQQKDKPMKEESQGRRQQLESQPGGFGIPLPHTPTVPPVWVSKPQQPQQQPQQPPRPGPPQQWHPGLPQQQVPIAASQQTPQQHQPPTQQEQQQSTQQEQETSSHKKKRQRQRHAKQKLPPEEQQLQLPPQHMQQQPQQMQPPPQHMQQQPQQMQQPPQQMQQPPQQMQQPPQQMQQPPQQMQQPPQQMQQQPQQMQFSPWQMQQPQQMPPFTQQPQIPQQQQPGSLQQRQPGPSQQREPGPPQQRQTPDPNITTVSKAMGAVSVGRSGFIIPRRSNSKGSNIGKTITVETNHLALNIGKCIEAHHYDVDIQPDKPKFLLRAVVNEYLRQYFPKHHPGFDGLKNLYSVRVLPAPMENGYHKASVMLKEEGRKDPLKFEVTVKYAALVDISSLNKYLKSGTSLEAPRAALQCIDVIFRSSSVSQLIKVGRSFFSKPSLNMSFDLGEGLELYYGHFQSAILGWKPFINIDVAHKGFPKEQSVIDLIKDLTRGRYQVPLDHQTIEMLKKYLKNLKIIFEVPGFANLTRTYRVNDVCEPPKRLQFKLDNGRTTNVYDYFLAERKYSIKNPELPCLWVGGQSRKICYPVELCKVAPGQVITRKMTENQTTNMIRKAATNADERKRKIMEAIRKVNFNSSPSVRDFGISVADEFEKVSAQVLDVPRLKLDRDTLPRDGVWQATGFVQNTQYLTRWIIISLDRYTKIEDLRMTAQELQNAGRKMNLTVPQPEQILPNLQIKDLVSVFNKAKSDKVELIVTIVSPHGNNYAMVKQYAELQCGVLTQCIKSTTLRKMNMSTASNILLKINAKLTGVNQSLVPKPGVLSKKFMIMGADVTHPPPDQSTIPSIAAVTASHDRHAFKYNITLRLQPPRAEVIEQLAAMTEEHLHHYFKQNKFYPSAIMMFRDGVSEGQFEQVLNYELTQLRSACQRVSKDCRPTMTIIIVQKRHHTRFFPNPQDAIGKHRNVPVGTMVDKFITHPTELDFYLVSHASIQGTARPTRYHCIWNDANERDEDLQNVTYYLCHLFSRCARSVSYPAPTYYAHLACMRARVLTEGKRIDLSNLQAEQVKLRVLDKIIKERPMFFV